MRFVVPPPQMHGGFASQAQHAGASVPFVIAAGILAVICGLALEVYMGKILVKLQVKESLWRFSQLAMVPIILAAVASKSWLGLPIFFVALFKFGFPEVTTLLKAPWMGDSLSRRTKAFMFIDGFAYLAHHGGSAVVYGSLVGQLIHPLFLIIALPLCGQHAAAIVKYASHQVYGGLIVLLEVWFQCEFFNLLPHLRSVVPFVGLTSVMVAHYMWLANAVVFGLWNVIAPEEEKEAHIDVQGVQQARQFRQRPSIFMTDTFDAIRKRTLSKPAAKAMETTEDALLDKVFCEAEHEAADMTPQTDTGEIGNPFSKTSEAAAPVGEGKAVSETDIKLTDKDDQQCSRAGARVSAVSV